MQPARTAPSLHVDSAQVVLHSSQHSVAALIDRIAALERSAEPRADADSHQLAKRIAALEVDVQSKARSIQRLEESNKGLAEQLEDQRCAMLYIADDVKACSAELQQLQAAGGDPTASQHSLSDMQAQVQSVQQLGQEQEAELSRLRDEVHDGILDRLNRLQNTVAELQLPRGAVPAAKSSVTTKEVTSLQREVEECRSEVQEVRDLVGAAASKQAVAQAVEKMSTQISGMNADVETACQQVYALKTTEVNELIQARLTDTMVEVRADMAGLSKDLTAETQALGEQLTSAFNAIAEIEAGSFTTTEDHHILMELHTNVQSMQSSVRHVQVQLQEVAAVQNAPRETPVGTTVQQHIEKVDVELAELHATVQQVSASSTLLREQLVELSEAQTNRTDTVDSDAVHADMRQLESSVQLLQEGMAALQQSHAAQEQTVGQVSMRVDTLESTVAHSGADAQAAHERSDLVDSALQELRSAVEGLQQAVESVSASVPTHSAAQELAVSHLSEMRAELSLQAEHITALEQLDSSKDLSVVKHQLQETECSLNVVLGKVPCDC